MILKNRLVIFIIKWRYRFDVKSFPTSMKFVFNKTLGKKKDCII